MQEIDNKKEILDPHNSLKLFGLKEYFLELTKLFKTNKLPKIILFTGDKGIGKFTLSFHLINYIFSSNSNHPYDFENQEINKESLFYKSILSNVCENYIYIPNENNKKTKIEDIRNIKKKFISPSFNNMPRFTILDDVELLNINAANSLLKLIEEPSENNYFILINNKKRKIIETIKSRALETKVFLNKRKQNEIFENLIEYNNIEEHFSHKFINLSTPGRLIKFSENLKNYDINLKTSLFDATLILLENFKKTKNDIFLDFLNLFLEIKFSEKINFKKIENINIINNKINLMKLLYNYKNFNLSNNLVLDYIKKEEDYINMDLYK